VGGVFRLQGSARVNNVGLGQMYPRYDALGEVEAAVAQEGVSSKAKSSRKFRIMTDSTRVVMLQAILLPTLPPSFALDLCEDFKTVLNLPCADTKGHATFFQGIPLYIF